MVGLKGLDEWNFFELLLFGSLLTGVGSFILKGRHCILCSSVFGCLVERVDVVGLKGLDE